MARNNSNNIPPNNYQALLSNICALYDQVLKRGKTQNKHVLHAYWHIGKTVLQVTEGHGHTYGKQIVAHLSNDMTQKYGVGFGERPIRRGMRIRDSGRSNRRRYYGRNIGRVVHVARWARRGHIPHRIQRTRCVDWLSAEVNRYRSSERFRPPARSFQRCCRERS
ncbi:MAG: hypothetical protein JXO44_01320 [Clostridia bacterium]|nr:hypothetical protein [Deltaproteobacteria bacterium]MBN2897384.1 hypothetical protein [Clostridia bacterium]